ncbi:hypothetical protein [Nannocystis pusilla]|uniref:hypothetical protein n=1 Tax=Nannocystis pusilla TaxID=889268 RepID=UPI003B7C9465
MAGIACLAGACELRVHNESETASGSDTSSTSATTDGDGAPEVCLRYVACLKEIDAEAGAEAEATHGADGSCWSGDETAAADCLALCDAQLRNYAKAFPTSRPARTRASCRTSSSRSVKQCSTRSTRSCRPSTRRSSPARRCRWSAAARAC